MHVACLTLFWLFLISMVKLNCILSIIYYARSCAIEGDFLSTKLSNWNVLHNLPAVQRTTGKLNNKYRSWQWNLMCVWVQSLSTTFILGGVAVVCTFGLVQPVWLVRGLYDPADLIKAMHVLYWVHPLI